MTNAEKYIGDEDLIDTFIDEMADHIIENTDPFWKEDKNFLMGVLQKFFKKEVKPTLTEDERVILQGLKIMGIEKISRDKETDICLHYSSANRYGELGERFSILNLYFQFIKERRRI